MEVIVGVFLRANPSGKPDPFYSYSDVSWHPPTSYEYAMALELDICSPPERAS